MSSLVPSLQVGQLIGNYRVGNCLAEGGMGEVYEVVHTTLGRRAALKLIHPSMAQDANIVARFLREAQAANRVRHPGVIQIFEYGLLPDCQRSPYFVMELLEGETLSTRIRRAAQRHGGRLGISCLRLLQQVAKTLAAVHGQGLVHRDVKPANVMLVSDPEVIGGTRIKLLDFGIVKILNNASSPNLGSPATTGSQTVLGTPEFMAPEQWTARDRVDAKADVYALGVITFLCFAGRMPFIATNHSTLGQLHCSARPPGLADLDPRVPVALASLVSKMLEKDPARRPTMAEVDESLGHLLASSPESEHCSPAAPASNRPDLEEDLRIANLPTFTWEELDLGIVGPAYEETSPGDPAVHVSMLTSPVPLLNLSRRPTLLIPTLLSAPSNYVSQGPTADRTPPPASPVLSPRTRMTGSHASWPLALLSVCAIACVLVLLPERSKQQPDEQARLAESNSFALKALQQPASLAQSAAQPLLSCGQTPALSWVAAQPIEPLARDRMAVRVRKQHIQRSCRRITPTESCIRTPALTADQRKTLLQAFISSNAKLCTQERLVLSTRPHALGMKTVPATLSKATQTRLLLALRRLLFHDQSLPPAIEVRCPVTLPSRCTIT